MSSLASFTTAKTNGDTFIDSSSNDIVIRTSSDSQKILMGFSSNTSSLVRIGVSNILLGWSNISVSNCGTFAITSNMYANNMVYASNVYIGTATNFQNSNYCMYISGNGRIEGDLVVNGSITNINTNVNVTDQFYVHNVGTGPALIVNQEGSYNIAEFQQNGSTVMKMNANCYLSIGSNDAECKLDVQGDSIIRGKITSSNIVTSNIGVIGIVASNLYMGGSLIIDHSGIVQNSNFIPYLDATKIIGGNSSNLSFSSNYIHDRHIINSKLACNISLDGKVFINGCMNIGTQTSNDIDPYKFQVNHGDILVKGSNNFLNAVDHARINLGSSYYFISACKDVGLLFQCSNTTYPFMIEDTSGFIGVGTVDPAENVHIIGNAKISSNLYVLNGIGINTSNLKETLHLTLGNARFDSNVYVLNNMSIASSNSPSERFEVYGNNNAKFGSNVYISNAISVNTSNPLQRLHIQDGSVLVNENRNTMKGSIYIQFSNLTPFKFEQDSNARAYISNDSNEIQILSRSNLRYISTDEGVNVERMRVTGYGQLGVGTSNIHQSSIAHFKDMNNMSNAQVRIENKNGYSMITGISSGNNNVYIGTECNLNMIFQTNNNERFRITSNNLFGFGTSSPQSYIHVHAQSNNKEVKIQISDAGNTSGFQIVKADTQDCYINNTTANYLAFGTSNVERVRIDSTGKVGIGMQATGDSLEVSGNIRSSSGTIGPMFMLLPPITYTDVPVDSMLVLDNTVEAGNEVSHSTWRPLFNSSSFIYNNTSGETIQWNYARLILRGMSMTLSNDDITNISVQEYYYDRVPQYSNVTGVFSVSNMSYKNGYKTIVTPWFTNTVNDARHLAVYVHSTTYNSIFRFGSVYIQFKA